MAASNTANFYVSSLLDQELSELFARRSVYQATILIIDGVT